MAIKSLHSLALKGKIKMINHHQLTYGEICWGLLLRVINHIEFENHICEWIGIELGKVFRIQADFSKDLQHFVRQNFLICLYLSKYPLYHNATLIFGFSIIDYPIHQTLTISPCSHLRLNARSEE
jgi:hypothetical protein